MRAIPAVLVLVAAAAAAAAVPVLASNEDVEVLFDGSDPGAWDVARDVERVRREFSQSALTAAGQPPALQWRFISRGVEFNDIFLRRPIRRSFDAIRVTLRNAGEPFRLGAKTLDASGAEWAADPVDFPQGDWREVVLRRDGWKPASWSRDTDGRLDFPLAYFTLIAFGVRPGPQYAVDVRRVEVLRPDPPEVEILELSLPGALEAERDQEATLRFRAIRPSPDDVVMPNRKQFTVRLDASTVLKSRPGSDSVSGRRL